MGTLIKVGEAREIKRGSSHYLVSLDPEPDLPSTNRQGTQSVGGPLA